MKISREKKRLYRLIRAVGSALMVLCMVGLALFSNLWIMLLFFVGAAVAGVGEFLYQGLYRCPACRTYLHTKGKYYWRTEKLYGVCPGCGWKVQIEIE